MDVTDKILGEGRATKLANRDAVMNLLAKTFTNVQSRGNFTIVLQHNEIQWTIRPTAFGLRLIGPANLSIQGRTTDCVQSTILTIKGWTTPQQLDNPAASVNKLLALVRKDIKSNGLHSVYSLLTILPKTHRIPEISEFITSLGDYGWKRWPAFAAQYAISTTDRWPEIEQSLSQWPEIRDQYLKTFPEAKAEWLVHGWLDWLDP